MQPKQQKPVFHILRDRVTRRITSLLIGVFASAEGTQSQDGCAVNVLLSFEQGYELEFESPEIRSFLCKFILAKMCLFF